MDRDERLRRRREQYRVRRAAETPQQRDQRLARRREYERARRAALSSEQRRAINDARRANSQQNTDQEFKKEQSKTTDQADLHLDSDEFSDS